MPEPRASQESVQRAPWWQWLSGSVQARVLLVILIATVPVAAGLGYYMVRQYDEALQASELRAENTLRYAAAYEQALIEDGRLLLVALSQGPILRHQRWDECDEYLSALLSHMPTYLNLGVISPQGYLFCAARSDIESLNTYLGDRDYFQRALQTDHVVSSDFIVGRITHNPMILLALQVTGMSGQAEGVLFAALDLSFLQAAAIQPDTLPGAHLWILDRQGRILQHHLDSSLQPGKRVVPYPIGHEGLWRTTHQDDPGREWVSFSLPAGPVGDPLGLSVRYQVPLSSLQADARQALWNGLLIMALLLCLTVLMAGGLLQVAAGRSLSHLSEAVRRLAARDFSWRVAGRLRGRELQAIGQQFDAMAQAMQAYERTLKESEQSYRQLVEGSPNAILVQSQETGRFLAVNQQAQKQYGYDAARFKTLSLDDVRLRIVDEDPAVRLSHQIHKGADGQERFVEVRRLPITFHGSPADVLLIRDLTEQRAQQQALARQATHDALTGLIHRNELVRRLRALSGEERRGVLVLMNLDGFKEVNVALGHEAGDQLLRQIADRLRHELGPDCLLARLGGDEFVFLFQGSLAQTQARVELLAAQLRAPFTVNHLRLRISASFGLVELANSKDRPDALISYADTALRRARSESISIGVFRDEDHSQMHQGLLLRGELREALVQDQFVLHMQPKVRLAAGQAVAREVTQFEALARWCHPEQGLISPDRFIPVIEVSDLVHPFTRWVIERSVAHCTAWQTQHPDVGVSANISARNLLNLNFPRQVARILEQHGLPAPLLELEVTERVIMADPARALEALTALRELGVRIAIDDFGTGYSSLAYLTGMPIDTLKIDRSFVARVLSDEGTRAVVRSIIEMSHGLNIDVVAEGVESMPTLQALANMGCNQAQGYAIARPMAMEAALSWLADYSW